MAFILIAVVVAVVLHIFSGLLWALPFWGLAGLFIYLNRNPDRLISSSPLGVVSPIDGKVEDCDKVYDPYLDREAIRIRIHMFSLGPYTIRSPTEGKIIKQWFMPPAPEGKDADQARVTLWIQTDENDDIALVAGKGRMGLHPTTSVQAGERVGQGQCCGRARFPVKIDVLVPVGTRIDVSDGDRIKAGSDIATLIRI